MITRRQLLIGGGALSAAGVGAYFLDRYRQPTILIPGAIGSAAPARLSVRFPIPTIESGQASFYLAQSMGAYREVGLELDFELGAPETNPVRMVTAGTNDIGVLGGPDTLLVARGKGAPLKAIAVLHRNSNFTCLLTKQDSGITTVEQLNGKKVGFFFGHISTDVLRALFKRMNVKVEEVDTGFNYGQLISGQVDASWAFTVTAGIELPAKGEKINLISPADYGIVTHGYTIFATEESIKTKRDEILRFLTATFQGISATLAAPEKAVALMHKKSPQSSVDLLSRRQAAYNKVTSNSEAFPIGYMDEQMFSDTYERLQDVGSIAKQFDFRSAYTTEFLEEIHGRKFG